MGNGHASYSQDRVGGVRWMGLGMIVIIMESFQLKLKAVQYQSLVIPYLIFEKGSIGSLIFETNPC